MKQSIIVGLAGATTIASLGGLWMFSALTSNVALAVDGQPETVRVSADQTVAQVLAQQQVTLNAHDVVSPALSTPVTDKMQITVEYAHRVDLTIDGVPRSVWTVSPTVGDLVAEYGITSPTARVTPDPATRITVEGVAIKVVTPKLVSLRVDGQTATFETTAANLAELFVMRGVTLGEQDRITPDPTSPLSDGMTITVQRVQTSQVITTEEIPFGKTKKNDATLEKGKTKVETEGVNGVKEQVWTVVTVDGVEESRTLASESISSEPVTEVTLVGTKKADATAAAASGGGGTSTSVPAPAVPAGSNQEIARAIMPEFGFGDDQFGCLVNLWQRESGWRTNAQNRYSGAYGIPQALPGSKMAKFGADWQTNPATQIRWGLSYIQGRYGTPCGAWNFFLGHNWY